MPQLNTSTWFTTILAMTLTFFILFQLNISKLVSEVGSHQINMLQNKSSLEMKPTDCEESLSSYMSKKGMKFSIYSKLKHSEKSGKPSLWKVCKIRDSTLFMSSDTGSQQTHENLSASLIIKEIQMKPLWNTMYPLQDWPSLMKQTMTDAGQDLGSNKCFYNACGSKSTATSL